MLTIAASARDADPAEMDDIQAALDARHGVVLASGVEYPGRYTRWDIGFVDPPLMLEGRGFRMRMRALTPRGVVPFVAFRRALEALEGVTVTETEHIDGAELPEVAIEVASQRDELLPEEQRTRRRSTFSVLRALIDVLPDDAPHLGLYGAFGYDLVRQIEALREPEAATHAHDTATQALGQRDLTVYLPDSVLAVDRQRGDARRYDFDFSVDDGIGGVATTTGAARTETRAPYAPPASGIAPWRDHEPGEYAALVRAAKASFARGDLFEVVPGQAFRRPLRATPAALFAHLKRVNPAPYGAFMNLGGNEFLVSASPEMFVRVNGKRVETVPISGTIARGKDAIEDADRILELLNSKKDASELTMCTDVDRNDKSRVCVPGSVRIIGRRQVELYSKVIHTVDHVEGELRHDMDGLDAFATHMWAVTVTGAPKIWAMRFIDEHERSPRAWYGGALGVLLANGDVNTGLTIRTAMIRDGVAEVRAGGTLLIDSVPEDEERETEMKASALLEAIEETGRAAAAEAPGRDVAGPRRHEPAGMQAEPAPTGSGHRILFLDHEDSFVHTLAGYMQETGAEVRTVRVPLGGVAPEALRAELDDFAPTLVVMSPGPGSPTDFRSGDLLDEVVGRDLPVFGVCLGHQAIGEYFGGSLGQLGYPLHGQERTVRVVERGFLDGLPEEFVTGRYHSLYIDPQEFPDDLVLIASDDDGIPMAIQHRTKPIFAVQFHPESLMTLRDSAGKRIIEAVLERLPR
ncbi:anthranilate synthase component I [Pseudoclavibacter endophyticus]|uniref:Anthranilate synthase n=1 Tax=Pseudoclavibacter endophyticus TaxID=1778590 RepID=A0A6H9WEM2_9MICO|nr:anthranilate synthase component I [Pseudoclavibacter endophyticus]KAB1649352.1 anthranilate synthase component I [Pseudoclavibacter endophyticus]GGA63265.1 anthranilate synthase component I [Pseudoclavibacter endophyticus]